MSVLFLAGIWWIWRQRNIFAYGDYCNGDRWLIHQIHILAQDCYSTWERKDLSRKDMAQIMWQRPEHGFVKLDVHGW